MPKIKDIAEAVIVALATNDFAGINAAKFWAFVQDLEYGTLSETYKGYLWKWLLELDDFQVLHITGDGKKKPVELELGKVAQYEEFFTSSELNNYLIKVTDDYQSIYLAGVKKKDNSLGSMPYELLRGIASAKYKGISSIDLIKKTGQDKRSLTNRLQLLVDQGLIKKKGIIAYGANTYHLTHFRFTSVVTEESQQLEEHYDADEIIVLIIDMIKKSENGFKLTREMFEEIKPLAPHILLKRFNAIVRFLVNNKYLEHIQVEDKERKRYYPALRQIKELPPAGKSGQIDKLIRQQSKLGGDTSNNGEIEDEDEFVPPHINRFFPLGAQIYDFVEQHPGTTGFKIETHFFGSTTFKVFTQVLDSLSTVTVLDSTVRCIIGTLVHTGKAKMYHYTTQATLTLRNPEYTPPPDITLPEPPKSTLFEEHALYGAQFWLERRFKIIKKEASDGTFRYFFIIKSYSGPLGLYEANKFPTRSAFKGHYESSDNWVALDVTKGKVHNVKKNMEAYKKKYEQMVQMAEQHNKQIEEIKEQVLQDTVFNVDPDLHLEDTNNEIFQNLSSPEVIQPEIVTPQIPVEVRDIDYGPEFRRKMILKHADEEGCICISVDFCGNLSKEMKLDYTIDRRTMIRDCEHLVNKGLVKAEKHPNGRYIVTSLKNPPTEEDILKAASSGNSMYRARRFAKEVVVMEKLDLKSVKTLKTGRKFADQEARLEFAMKRSEESRRKPMSRKAKVIGAGINKRILELDKQLEKSDDESEDDEGDITTGNVEEEDENEGDVGDDTNAGYKELRKKGRPPKDRKDSIHDLLLPLMDDRKRKKLASHNKPHARVANTFKKIRSSIKISNEHILLFIKAIIVTQSLSQSSNIDWPKVVLVLDNNYEADMLRRHWTKYRKMLGPKNLMTARKNWEKALFEAIEQGKVGVKELEDVDVFRMMDLWATEGADIFIDRTDTRILEKYEDNFKTQVFKPIGDTQGSDMFRELISMVEKQQSLAVLPFMYPVKDDIDSAFDEEAENPSEMDIAKTKLKALFATEHDKFDSSKVRSLFSNISKELYASALTELEDKKAISFLGENSTIKFTLTEKLIMTLDCKLDDTFVDSSRRILEVLEDVERTKGSLLLSKKSAFGTYASIFGSISREELRVIRIDQKLDGVNSYYTKAWDRSKYESDFVLTKYTKKSDCEINRVAPLIDAPCSYLWVNLNGDFNERLWHKCVYVILWNIVFHPGVSARLLYTKLYPLLEPFEVKRILNWLVSRNNITLSEFNGYSPTDYWFDVR